MKRAFLSFLALFACITLATAQSRVSGIVLSAEDQEPVIGASVLLKGTTIGSITDIEGRFQISNVPDNVKTIVVSFVGMKMQEVPVSSEEMKILLQSDSKQIDEVVVVAYGTQKKSSFTGSASTVGATTIEKRALSNVTAALEGNATGLQVTSATGQPGESASVRIRGFGLSMPPALPCM